MSPGGSTTRDIPKLKGTTNYKVWYAALVVVAKMDSLYEAFKRKKASTLRVATATKPVRDVEEDIFEARTLKWESAVQQ